MMWVIEPRFGLVKTWGKKKWKRSNSQTLPIRFDIVAPHRTFNGKGQVGLLLKRR